MVLFGLNIGGLGNPGVALDRRIDLLGKGFRGIGHDRTAKLAGTLLEDGV